MANFARDCLEAFSALVYQLEVELGPDTCDLGLRIGLHSGCVTAGVLRGERARFQLFGDTVNTTARVSIYYTQLHWLTSIILHPKYLLCLL